MSLDLIKECKGAGRIGISGHVRPDGDCVGAVLSLQMYLEKCFPEALITVYLEQPSETFQKIKGFDKIRTDYPTEDPFDVYFALDCSSERLGEAEKYFQSAVKKINIDHHISNTGCGDINYIRPEVGSSFELIYDLIEKDKLDKEIAMAIYIGMIHDTGVFQYSNTTPETMEKAGKLISYGFDFAGLIQETFYRKNYTQTQIMGRALMESIRFMDNRCIVSVIEKKTMDFYNASPKDLEGIVSQLRNIEGIDCAIFMYQTDVMEYKVSLRSNEKIDAAKVAAYFGGGGHMRAAGCTMRGTFYDCVNNLSLHIEKELKSHD